MTLRQTPNRDKREQTGPKSPKTTPRPISSPIKRNAQQTKEKKINFSKLRDKLSRQRSFESYETQELSSMYWKLRDHAYYCAVNSDYNEATETERLLKSIKDELDVRGQPIANLPQKRNDETKIDLEFKQNVEMHNFDDDTTYRLTKLEMKHREERNSFNASWEGEKLRSFLVPSNRLRELRNSHKKLKASGKEEEAKQMMSEITELEKSEHAAAQTLADQKYVEEKNQLENKQNEEKKLLMERRKEQKDIIIAKHAAELKDLNLHSKTYETSVKTPRRRHRKRIVNSGKTAKNGEDQENQSSTLLLPPIRSPTIAPPKPDPPPISNTVSQSSSSLRSNHVSSNQLMKENKSNFSSAATTDIDSSEQPNETSSDYVGYSSSQEISEHTKVVLQSLVKEHPQIEEIDTESSATSVSVSQQENQIEPKENICTNSMNQGLSNSSSSNTDCPFVVTVSSMFNPNQHERAQIIAKKEASGNSQKIIDEQQIPQLNPMESSINFIGSPIKDVPQNMDEKSDTLSLQNATRSSVVLGLSPVVVSIPENLSIIENDDINLKSNKPSSLQLSAIIEPNINQDISSQITESSNLDSTESKNQSEVIIHEPSSSFDFPLNEMPQIYSVRSQQQNQISPQIVQPTKRHSLSSSQQIQKPIYFSYNSMSNSSSNKEISFSSPKMNKPFLLNKPHTPQFLQEEDIGKEEEKIDVQLTPRHSPAPIIVVPPQKKIEQPKPQLHFTMNSSVIISSRPSLSISSNPAIEEKYFPSEKSEQYLSSSLQVQSDSIEEESIYEEAEPLSQIETPVKQQLHIEQLHTFNKPYIAPLSVGGVISQNTPSTATELSSDYEYTYESDLDAGSLQNDEITILNDISYQKQIISKKENSPKRTPFFVFSLSNANNTPSIRAYNEPPKIEVSQMSSSSSHSVRSSSTQSMERHLERDDILTTKTKKTKDFFTLSMFQKKTVHTTTRNIE